MSLTVKLITIAIATGLIVLGLKYALRPNPTLPPANKQESPLSLATKEDTGGNVTVKVTPQTLAAGKLPSFSLVFDTHSVDLNFDVVKVSKLSDDTGADYVSPSWDGSPPGGHHRQGKLTFPTPINTLATDITLKFLDISGVPERTFTWKVK